MKLLLKIERDDQSPHEVECEGCCGCNRGERYSREIANQIILAGGEPYDVCHGKGTRPAWLVGCVEVEESDDKWRTRLTDIVADSLGQLMDIILGYALIKALPESLYADPKDPDDDRLKVVYE